MPQIPKVLSPSDGARELFGSEVRRHRERVGLSLADLAAKINYSPSFVGQVERAESGCERSFAEACDKQLDTHNSLAHLWDGLFAHRSQGVPEWFAGWPATEKTADTLWVYDPCVIHGLFQTRAYAATLLYGDEDLIAGRLNRQEVFTREEPPTVIYVLPEVVLWYDPGCGAEVMREQLQHLIASVSPNVAVQIVPNGALHPGNEGGMMIATLKGRVEVGYVETAARGMIMEAPRDLARLRERFDTIRAQALPVGMSVDLIQRTKEQHWTT